MNRPVRWTVITGVFCALSFVVSGAWAVSLPVKAMKQKGPACLPACGAMALSLYDSSVTAIAITREMPMYPDGSGFFDLQEVLERRGYGSMVWQGTASEAACAVVVGLPVIAAVNVRGQKHTVLVAGADYAEGATVCVDAPRTVDVIDPQTAARSTLPTAKLNAWLFARQLMVVHPPDTRVLARLAGRGFPVERVGAENRRFRAEALVRRARKHEQANDQMVRLLERAVREDPCWGEARTMLTGALAKLGRRGQIAWPTCAEGRSPRRGGP